MIWVIGFRAAGKTTLGARLARHLGWEFRDLDREFERRYGKPAEFADRFGIEQFREEECGLLRGALSGGDRTVIATGGGFVDHAPSREIVANAPGPKWWVDPPVEVLWERLQKDESRIKIGDLSSIEGVRVLLEKRRPFYEKIASFRTNGRDISECLALLEGLADER
jgi:shikimate kinase